MILFLAAIGFLGLGTGVMAMWRLARTLHSAWEPGTWRWLKWVAHGVGLALAAASLLAAGSIGYAIDTPDGPGRIVGVPFFIAFFDAQGSDYLSPLSLVAAGANALFWFFVPQIALAGVALARRRSARPPQIPAP